MAWKFDLSGNLLTTTALGVDGMQQGAKIRADPVNGGYVIAGSVWMDDQQGIVVKMNNDLSVAWSQDTDLTLEPTRSLTWSLTATATISWEDTLLLASPTGTTWPLRWTVQPSKSSGGGPMTAGVTNWDYLAIKV